MSGEPMYTHKITKLDEVTHEVRVLVGENPYGPDLWETYLVIGVGSGFQWVSYDTDDGPEKVYPSFDSVLASIDNSVSARAEASYESACSDYYGGTGPVTIDEQCAEARRLK